MSIFFEIFFVIVLIIVLIVKIIIAFKKIKQYQKFIEFLIFKLSFARIIKKQFYEINRKNFKIQTTVLNVLRKTIKIMLIDEFQNKSIY